MRIAVALLVFAVILISLGLFFVPPKAKPLYTSDKYYPTTPTLTTSADQLLIQEINQRNNLIKTFQASLRGEIKRLVKVQIHGDVYYEKPKNCSFTIRTRLTKEVEMGSNNSHFWFWSRRMRPPTLYYAKHSDLYKTRLKPAFNPVWMIQSLNIDPINTNGANLENYEGYLRVVTKERATNGQIVTKAVLINRERKLVVGHYLFDDSNELITSMEINDFFVCNGFSVPSEVQVIWVDTNGERVALEWKMENHKMNVGIPSSYFRMPTISPAVDMGSD